LAHRHDQAHGVRQGRLHLGARVRRRPRARPGHPPVSGPVKTPLCDLLGIEHPIVGFTPSEHVAAAVSRAGGLGVLGCVRFNDPAELDTVLDWMDRNTDGRPYGIDVVMPARVPAEGGQQDLTQLIPQTHKDFVERTLLRLGVPPLPDGAQAANGVDIVVAQGYEAGGHTGEIATMVLVPEIVDAVGEQTPVLAAGGIGCGRQVAAALALGAVGAWMGSAWLVTSEYQQLSAAPAVQQALLAATSSDTTRSRIYSGKPARLLKNKWTDAWEQEGAPEPLRMPLQNLLVSEAHQRLMRSGQPDVVPMPAGQIVGRMSEIRPVADLMAELVRETSEVLDRLGGLR